MGGYDTDLPKIPEDPTPWLTLAKKYLGEHELAGATADNPFVIECFKHTTYHAIHDEVPWCAAFVCKVLEDSGFSSTKSAAANSYTSYGMPTTLKPGAILVFHWPAGGQHVTFCNRVIASSSLVECLGGNQGDSVKLTTFNAAYIYSTRWPIKA